MWMQWWHFLVIFLVDVIIVGKGGGFCVVELALELVLIASKVLARCC